MKSVLFNNNYLKVDWPAPAKIKAFCTTRMGGYSLPPFDSFNLADHVGDQVEQVIKNRGKLKSDLGLPSSPFWLDQIHSCNLVNADLIEDPAKGKNQRANLQADACYASIANKVCAVMTADCLPLLFCNKQGDWIAAIHAGWRGLADGIVQKTIEAYPRNPSDLIAWMGPAITQSHFEVGENVRIEFIESDSNNSDAFKPLGNNKYLCDIYLIARKIFDRYSVKSFGGGICSYDESSLFFSYRRDGKTGRMASLIWIDEAKKLL